MPTPHFAHKRTPHFAFKRTPHNAFASAEPVTPPDFTGFCQTGILFDQVFGVDATCNRVTASNPGTTTYRLTIFIDANAIGSKTQADFRGARFVGQSSGVEVIPNGIAPDFLCNDWSATPGATYKGGGGAGVPGFPGYLYYSSTTETRIGFPNYVHEFWTLSNLGFQQGEGIDGYWP